MIAGDLATTSMTALSRFQVALKGCKVKKDDVAAGGKVKEHFKNVFDNLKIIVGPCCSRQLLP